MRAFGSCAAVFDGVRGGVAVDWRVSTRAGKSPGCGEELLAGDVDRPVPPGSLGGAAALERLAEITEAGLEPGQHDHLAYFAIRVGARRLADAAACLEFIGQDMAAGIAGEQARAVGALQHPLVTGDRATVAMLLRRLAPMYAHNCRPAFQAAEATPAVISGVSVREMTEILVIQCGPDALSHFASSSASPWAVRLLSTSPGRFAVNITKSPAAW